MFSSQHSLYWRVSNEQFLKKKSDYRFVMQYTKIEKQDGNRVLLFPYRKKSNNALLTQRVIRGKGHTAVNIRLLMDQLKWDHQQRVI